MRLSSGLQVIRPIAVSPYFDGGQPRFKHYGQLVFRNCGSPSLIPVTGAP
jgi:hypothetical protein